MKKLKTATKNAQNLLLKYSSCHQTGNSFGCKLSCTALCVAALLTKMSCVASHRMVTDGWEPPESASDTRAKL